MSGISKDLFNMWRCVTCLAHADGVLRPEERAMLERTFDSLDRVYALSDDEKSALRADLDTPRDMSDFLPLVQDPQYKSSLLHFARLLAYADGTVAPEERAILDKLRAAQASDDAIAGLRRDTWLDAENRTGAHEERIEDLRDDALGGSPVLRALSGFLSRMGIHLV